MIRTFRDKGTEDVWNGDNSAQARKIAGRKLDMIHAAHEIGDLAVPPGNRLEKLKGDLKEYHSVRINGQYRIIFKWDEGAAHDVEITDDHRG